MGFDVTKLLFFLPIVLGLALREWSFYSLRHGSGREWRGGMTLGVEEEVLPTALPAAVLTKAPDETVLLQHEGSEVMCFGVLSAPNETGSGTRAFVNPHRAGMSWSVGPLMSATVSLSATPGATRAVTTRRLLWNLPIQGTMVFGSGFLGARDLGFDIQGAVLGGLFFAAFLVTFTLLFDFRTQRDLLMMRANSGISDLLRRANELPPT